MLTATREENNIILMFMNKHLIQNLAPCKISVVLQTQNVSRQNKENTLKKNVSVKTQVHCCVHSDGYNKNNQTAQTEEALDRSTV